LTEKKDKYRSYSYKKDPLFNGRETTITITITLDSDSNLKTRRKVVLERMDLALWTGPKQDKKGTDPSWPELA